MIMTHLVCFYSDTEQTKTRKWKQLQVIRHGHHKQIWLVTDYRVQSPSKRRRLSLSQTHSRTLSQTDKWVFPTVSTSVCLCPARLTQQQSAASALTVSDSPLWFHSCVASWLRRGSWCRRSGRFHLKFPTIWRRACNALAAELGRVDLDPIKVTCIVLWCGGVFLRAYQLLNLFG